MRVTIKSIARDLGISHMTVSRALSGNEHVNAQTRQRVQAYAEKVGYIRSSAASAMRGDPTAIIGLLLPNIVNDFYARFANSLGLMCAEAGLDLVIHLTGDDAEREAHCLTRLQALQARLVLRVPAPSDGSTPALAKSLPSTINLIRQSTEQPGVGELLIDDAPAIHQAITRLHQRGCRRIAYLGGADNLSTGRQRFRAFRDGLAAHGLSLHDALVQTGTPMADMGHERMQHLLDAPEPPDGVVCGGFEISDGALRACLQRQVRLPETLAFVGYGDPGFYQWLAGGVSSIALSAQEVARQTIGMTLAAGSEQAFQSHRVAARFVGRQTA